MKQFFHQNKVLVGIVAGLGSLLACALLIGLVLAIVGIPVMEHLNWFAGCFLPLVLVLRYYAKEKEYLTVTKTLIVVTFLAFVAFMVILKMLHFEW